MCAPDRYLSIAWFEVATMYDEQSKSVNSYAEKLFQEIGLEHTLIDNHSVVESDCWCFNYTI